MLCSSLFVSLFTYLFLTTRKTVAQRTQRYPDNSVLEVWTWNWTWEIHTHIHRHSFLNFTRSQKVRNFAQIFDISRSRRALVSKWSKNIGNKKFPAGATVACLRFDLGVSPIPSLIFTGSKVSNVAQIWHLRRRAAVLKRKSTYPKPETHLSMLNLFPKV